MPSKKKQEVSIEDFKEIQDVANYWYEQHEKSIKQLIGQSRKLRSQRQQLRMYQEKMELMRTWRGLVRTVGQILGICK